MLEEPVVLYFKSFRKLAFSNGCSTDQEGMDPPKQYYNSDFLVKYKQPMQLTLSALKSHTSLTNQISIATKTLRD